MPRLMSVALTEDAVRSRTKTVTRRLGWHQLKMNDRLTLCRKVMGRKPGEPLVRITDVEVVALRWERLDTITQPEVDLEGLGHMTPAEFVEFFCASHTGCQPETVVHRIEWRYPPLVVVAPTLADAGEWVERQGVIGCRPWFITPDRTPTHAFRKRRLFAGGQVVDLGAMTEQIDVELRQLGWDGVIADAAAL